MAEGVIKSFIRDFFAVGYCFGLILNFYSQFAQYFMNSVKFEREILHSI